MFAATGLYQLRLSIVVVVVAGDVDFALYIFYIFHPIGPIVIHISAPCRNGDHSSLRFRTMISDSERA